MKLTYREQRLKHIMDNPDRKLNSPNGHMRLICRGNPEKARKFEVIASAESPPGAPTRGGEVTRQG
jgi:hypothetical protein